MLDYQSFVQIEIEEKYKAAINLYSYIFKAFSYSIYTNIHLYISLFIILYSLLL